MGKESIGEQETCKYAQTRSTLARKYVSPGHRGVPDHLFIVADMPTYYIEFKAPLGGLEDHQKREIQRMRDRGAMVYVVDNVERAKHIIDGAAERSFVPYGDCDCLE